MTNPAANNLKTRLLSQLRNHTLLESSLFLLLMSVQILIFLYLIVQHRIPEGSDGFHHFCLQYYFLDNAVNTGEIPLWMPFMTHGTTATWWYAVQGVAGIFPNALFHIAGLIKEVNFVIIYYLGMFLDELLLLVGVWLLARRYFTSPFTILFVAICIMGSSGWMAQPYFNLYFYYAIPLILYFLHLFIEKGKWRYLFLAGNLFIMQTIGNNAYQIPVASLVIFLYFLFYFIFSNTTQPLSRQIKQIRWGWPSFLCLSSLSILFFMYYSLLHIGTENIVNLNYGRDANSVSLNVFLTYAGNTGLAKWLELFLRVSPAADYTLYIGLLTIPLILVGGIIHLRMKGANPYYLCLLCLTVVILLFSMATFVSVFFYYCWPLMKFFRHLALVSPLVKVFLCFLAGFGFETLFLNGPHTMRREIYIGILALIAILLMELSVGLFRLAGDFHASSSFVSSLVNFASLRLIMKTFYQNILPFRLMEASTIAAAAGLLFGFLVFINLKKYRMYIIYFALGLQLVDIYGYKLSEIGMRTAPLNREQYRLTAFQPFFYQKTRQTTYLNNPRTSILNALFPDQVGLYWSSFYSFIFED